MSPPWLNNVLIHQQHDSSEYKVRGGNGNVLITLEAGVERDIRNYYKITCLARWSLKFQNKLDRNYSHKTVNKKIMFFVWLSEEPSDIIVIVWTLVIPVHHCQLYQDILVLTTYLINIRVAVPPSTQTYFLIFNIGMSKILLVEWQPLF